MKRITTIVPSLALVVACGDQEALTPIGDPDATSDTPSPSAEPVSLVDRDAFPRKPLPVGYSRAFASWHEPDAAGRHPSPARNLLEPDDASHQRGDASSGVVCDDGEPASCSFSVPLLPTAVGPIASFDFLDDGSGFDWSLGDEHLAVRLCESSNDLPCIESIVGERAPTFPGIGFLADVLAIEPPLARVALERGDSILQEIDVPPVLAGALASDRRYVYYLLQDAGFEAGIPGLDAVKLALGGDSSMMLWSFSHEPEHQLFYTHGSIPGFPFGGSSDDASDPGNNGGDGSDSNGNDNSPDNPDDNPNGSDDDANDSDNDNDESSPVDLSTFALSAEPTLTLTPVRTEGVEAYMDPVQGDLYLAGSIPVYPLMSLNGEVIANLDPDGDGDNPFTADFYTDPDLVLAGNGVLKAGVPFLDFSALGLRLGEASMKLSVTDEETSATFSGIVTTEEFLTGLPLPIRPDGTLAVWGHFSDTHLAESFFHAEGNLSIGADVLGQMTGLPLGTLASADAILHASADGLLIEGSTSSQIHADVRSASTIGFRLLIAPDGRPTLQLFGDMQVGATTLSSATLTLSPDGMEVTGIYTLPSYTLSMTGKFQGDSYRITGAVDLADPVAINNDKIEQLLTFIEDQDHLRAGVQTTVKQQSAKLANLQSDVDAANRAVTAAAAEVSRLAVLIKRNTGWRNKAWSNYRSWQRKSCKWWDAGCHSKRAAKMSYYYSQYAYYVSVIGTLQASKAVAQATLGAAQAILNPLNDALVAAVKTLETLHRQLADLDRKIAEARTQLAKLPNIDGDLAMTLHMTLADGAMTYGVTATLEGVGALEGTVDMSATPPTACAIVPGAGPICTEL